MKWIKKPIVVEAVQYKEYGKLVKGMCNSVSCYTEGNNKPHVHTIHDNQIVLLEVGDYIIPEPDGEHYYPCKPDIFEKTYSPFDESINQEGSLKDSDWKDMWYSNSKRTKLHSEIEEDIEWIEQNVAVPLKETNKEILGRWVATLDKNKALQNRIKELEELTIEIRNAYQNYVGVLAQEVFELGKFIKKNQLSDEWLQTWQAQEVDGVGINARKNLSEVLSKIQPKPDSNSIK